MIRIEDALIKEIGDVAIVDGHDAGSGEMNIFLLTDDTTRSFQESRKVLEAIRAMDMLRAAFRELASDDYRIIWPPGLTSFSVA
jgi:hypothetical protein